MSVYDFKVILEPDPDGGYVISCPSLPVWGPEILAVRFRKFW